MFSQSMNPVTQGGMLYPTHATPRGQDFVCPTCHSTNRSHITSIVFSPQVVKELNKALGQWNDWVFQQGVTGVLKGAKKIDGYNFQCGWCGNNWWVASELILNEIILDQILQIHKFTMETKKEFGAIVLRTSRGIMLDMTQIGQDLSISFELTRDLTEDEEILGSCHCHPVSDEFSKWDVATFLNNEWENICMLIGSEGTIWVAVKTSETAKISGSELEGIVKEWEDTNKPLPDIAGEFKFLMYKGKPEKLEEVSGNNPTTTLEELVKVVKGSKTF